MACTDTFYQTIVDRVDATDARLLQRVGLNLRAERARRNLTQETVARMSGLGPTQIARMERGETDTGISKYLRVAQAIGIKPADLFFDVDRSDDVQR